MKIGVSLGSFINSTFEGAIKFCLKLSEEYNLNAVEIRLERENCRASIWPWEITSELKKLKSV
ncbi:MAG: hypothetical protein RMJ67_07085 [Elusimicrobiota bacterium]|nr:hypothetical protein [Endomicrobiia bacterium]MDW8166259.1 hypothetical protein [Elusimicrobiota bacterium]